MDLFALALDIKSTGTSEAKAQLASLDQTGRKTASGFNIITAEMAKTAAQSLGLGTNVGKLGSALAMMGSGGIITAGFVAGAYLIKSAYDTITEGAREAKKHIEEVTAALDKEIEARKRASSEGRSGTVAEMRAELAKARADLAALQAPATFSSFGAAKGAAPTTVDPNAVKRTEDLAKATERVRQAELDLADARTHEVKEGWNLTLAAEKAYEDLIKPDKKKKVHKERENQEKQAAGMLRDIRNRTIEDGLRAAGKEDDADRARIKTEFDRRDDEIKQLRVSEATKTALLLASATERAAALAALEAKIDERLKPKVFVKKGASKERLPGELPTPEEFDKMVAENIKQYEESIIRRFSEMDVTIRQGIADTLGDAIQNGFEAAFNGEGLGGVLKAFGKTILAGVGSVLVDLGKTWLEYGILMTTLGSALWNPFTSGPAAIAIGAALIALGGALGAIAHGGGTHGATSGRSFNDSRSASENITRIKFVDSRTGMPDVTPRQPIHFTVIGANDPSAQRMITDLVTKASRRAA